VPGAVRSAAEQVVGAPILRAVRVWGGYAPSATFRLFLADGRRLVFKGINATSNDVMRDGLQAEERAYGELTQVIGRWAPAYFGSLRHADWHAILIEDVGPAQVPPWTARRAAAALRDYAAFHTASLGRSDLPDWLPRDRHHSFARTWRSLGDERGGLESVARLAGERSKEAQRWLDRHVHPLQAAAERLIDIDEPHALLHFDTRSDNLRILPGGRLKLFDWPYVSIGPHEFDMVACVQSIHAEGGPPPERCLAWYGEGIEVRPVALEASIASLAGFFADRAWRPPIPGLPRVRSIQRRQLRSSLRWCARNLELPEPSWVDAVAD
jgi:hypothetical protein